MGEVCSDGRDRLLKGHRVVLNDEAARIPAPGLPGPRPAPSPQDGPAGRPEVHIVKADDGTVQKITVRCPCGRETTLECEYFPHGDNDEQQED